MRCSKCGAENPGGKKFCGDCAAPLANLCPKCSADNPAGKRFCGECGAALGTSAAPAEASAQFENRATDAPAAENLDGERKTVTALFADIKGSTELEQDLDPEEARAIVDPALRLMIDAVHRYDGYIVQSTGDGVFALFGAPLAHEDHPQRALYAALRMQDDMRRYADKLRADGRSPLQIRIGADTGEVVLRSIETGGRTEYSPIGNAANLASRMQALANPGSTVIAENTRRLVEGYFQLKALGPARLKGINEPVNVYEVTGFGPLRTRLQRSVGRGLTRFVGREREMEALRHVAEHAHAGHGQVVAAVAMAGVGKSRLFYEFKARTQSEWMVLEAFSVSHGKASAYLPVLELLRGYFGIEDDDDARKRRERVNGKVLTLDRTLEDALPYMFGLLGLAESDDPLAGMDAQVRHRRTLDAIKRVLLRESLNQPLMVMFEDLHWIDDETQALLNLLADSIGTARILLLVNYRPEYSHQWASKSYYTQLRLDPLGRESAEEMLSSLLGDGPELAPLRRLILDKTEGNPLFMEEIVQALREEGALVRNGGVHLARPLDALKVPTTVQAVLASRIDRLSPDQKGLLQTLAVIGTEIPLALVREVVKQPNDQLDCTLNQLQLAEFIYEQPAAGDVEYTFKHALTHEVAYNSVLMERRRQMHELIAAAIESVYADSLDDHVDQLAHHYRRSGNAAKAIQYLSRAAELATTRNAVNEAVAGYRQALALLDGIADPADRERREAVLQTALGGALSMRNPAEQGVVQVYLRARELCERTGNREELLTVFFGLRLAYNFRAELRRALELGEQMLNVIPDDDASARPSVVASIAQTLFFMGEFTAALQHLRQIQTKRSVAPVKSWLVWNRLLTAEPRARGALTLGVIGFPDQALSQSLESIADARVMQLPLAYGLSEYFCAQVSFYRGEVYKVREHAQAAVRVAGQQGNGQLGGYALAFDGWAEAQLADPERGIRMIRQAMEQLESVGARLHSLQDLLLIECLEKNGAIAEALEAAANGIDHALRTGERYCLAELHRHKGELLILNDDRESAEAAFHSAIEVARAQQARWWELRATTSLARLLRDTNRRDEARAMLAEIYGWFTEGFDTADLKDAKALLEELGA